MDAAEAVLPGFVRARRLARDDLPPLRPVRAPEHTPAVHEERARCLPLRDRERGQPPIPRLPFQVRTIHGGEIDLGHDIAVVQQEGFPPLEQWSRVEEPAARVQGGRRFLVFPRHEYRDAQRRRLGPPHHLLGKIVRVHDQAVGAGRDEVAGDVLQERNAAEVDERLGRPVGQRPQAAPLTRREDHRLHRRWLRPAPGGAASPPTPGV